jgi:archaellum component FlaC
VVQSPVPIEVFRVFVKALETGTKVPVTRENAASVSLLVAEFWFDDIPTARSATSSPEFITALSEQISSLEHQMSSQPLAVAELKESIANHDRQLEGLRFAIETKPARLQTQIDELRHSVVLLQTELRQMKSRYENETEAIRTHIGTVEESITARLSVCQQRHKQIQPTSPTPDTDPDLDTSTQTTISPPISTPSPVSTSKSLKAIEFPLKEDKSFDGIISYLTRKHGGNVHDKGIVTVTSKSTWDDDSLWAPRNAADLTSRSCFQSKNEPGQWICWNFHKMRVRPTHYSINSGLLKAWVVEGSMDGDGWFIAGTWIEIDRQTDNNNSRFASFTVSDPCECRFIRLTQTEKNHNMDDYMYIYAFEVFGTLVE